MKKNKIVEKAINVDALANVIMEESKNWSIYDNSSLILLQEATKSLKETVSNYLHDFNEETAKIRQNILIAILIIGGIIVLIVGMGAVITKWNNFEYTARKNYAANFHNELQNEAKEQFERFGYTRTTVIVPPDPDSRSGSGTEYIIWIRSAK